MCTELSTPSPHSDTQRQTDTHTHTLTHRAVDNRFVGKGRTQSRLHYLILLLRRWIFANCKLSILTATRFLA